jgi:tetratricopeptide (TPR) repeat protein
VNTAQERMSQMKSGTEWQMAQQQFLAGDLDKALKSVDSSISLNPKVAKSHTLRGRILIEKGQLEAARASLLEAEKIDPKFVEAQYYLGIIHERFSQPEEALGRYTKAIDLDKSSPQYLIAAAEMMVQLGRLDDAEKLLSQHQDDFRFNAAVRQTLGHIATMRSDPKHATELYNEAALLAPDDMGILEDLTRSQVASGQYAEAEFNLRRLLQTDDCKNRRDLKHLQARCLIAVDRPVEARSILIALTGDGEGSKDVRAWIDLGNVACILSDKARLKSSSNRVLALAPDRYEGYFLKAMNLRLEGDTKGAMSAIETAVSKAGSNPEPLLFRGIMNHDLGQAAAAAADYTRAVELNPTNTTAKRLLEAQQKSSMATVPVER